MLKVGISISLIVALIVPFSAFGTSSYSPSPIYLKGLGVSSLSRPSVAALSTDADQAVNLPTSPVMADIAAEGDWDLYKVPLSQGQRLEISITGPAASAFDLYLYSPAFENFNDVTAVAHASEGGYPRTITYDVPAALGGMYFIEVNAFSGSGTYELSWRVREPAENMRIDVGAATPAAIPMERDITLEDKWGSNRLFAITLPANRRVQVDLSGPADADFDVYLYAPGTGSILPQNVSPKAWSNRPTSNESFIFDVPAGVSRTYFLEVLRFRGAGSARLEVIHYPIPVAPSATRIWGVDRFATAAEISQRTYPAGSATAVLVNGREFPDGLAASSLAGALNAPILLTELRSLPASTLTEMRRLRVSKVFIAGGTGAVSDAVLASLRAGIPGVAIERIPGRDRYDTAARIAEKVRTLTGQRPGRVFLASGETFPDALSLSPIAFATREPIILTRRAILPPASLAAIKNLRPPGGAMDVLIAGGTGAVDLVPARAAAAAAGGSVLRKYGESRYATSLKIAEFFIEGREGPYQLTLASGVTFPDALAGASLAGVRQGPLLLTRPLALSQQARDHFRSFGFLMNQCWVLGGTGAISPSVFNEVASEVARAHQGH